MLEPIGLTQHINKVIEQLNEINTAQWEEIEKLKKRVEELERKSRQFDIIG